MDRDLVERARAGDQEAFADLVHQTSDTLYGIARRILRDPELAEDVPSSGCGVARRRGCRFGLRTAQHGWDRTAVAPGRGNRPVRVRCPSVDPATVGLR